MKRSLALCLVLCLVCAACSEHESDFAPVGDVYPEVLPPAVVDTLPADGAVNVPVDASIAVTFSKPMDTSLVAEGTVGLPDGLTATLSWEDTTLTISPAPRLAYATTYNLTVPRGLRDTHGLATADDHPFSFTTVTPDDTTPPRVLATRPADGDSGVSVTSPVTITFSEPLDLHGVSGRVFTPAGGPPVRLDALGAEITLTPLEPLEFETAYTLTIPGNLTDLYDNPLGEDYSFSFTTALRIGDLIALAPGPQPETLFALDGEHLYRVHVTEQRVERRIPLPDNWLAAPTALCCPPESDLVCIGGESILPGGPGRRLCIYDIDSGTFTDPLDYSRTLDMQNLFITGAADLTVMPGRNLGVLYQQLNLLLQKTSTLSVVEPLSETVLAETAITGTEMAVAGNLLVTRSTEALTCHVLDGAVPRDPRRLERETAAWALSPDGERLFLVVPGGLEAYDPRDLSAAPLFHPLSGRLISLCASPDEEHLFALTADNRLLVLAADGAEVLDTRVFPPGTSALLATPNSDGSMVVGFADAPDSPLHGLYFFPVPQEDGQGGM